MATNLPPLKLVLIVLTVLLMYQATNQASAEIAANNDCTTGSVEQRLDCLGAITKGLRGSKLDAVTGWQKACVIFQSGNPTQETRYIVPKSWNTKNCADYMVTLGQDRIWFECISLDYIDRYDAMTGPAPELLPPRRIVFRGAFPDIREVPAQPHELPNPNVCGWIIP